MHLLANIYEQRQYIAEDILKFGYFSGYECENDSDDVIAVQTKTHGKKKALKDYTPEKAAFPVVLGVRTPHCPEDSTLGLNKVPSLITRASLCSRAKVLRLVDSVVFNHTSDSGCRDYADGHAINQVFGAKPAKKQMFKAMQNEDENCVLAIQQAVQEGRKMPLPIPSGIRRENKREKHTAVLATAELSAKSVDLAAVNLTELVNNMLGTALKGSKKFFSLLSVTSYSSFAFHKVSVTIYNISNLKGVDPGKFPVRHCYCLNNTTNDLTDFTALLVDILGNSTSYLTEIFKSTSILSVNQSNNSDCIYICMMTGQTGRNLSNFWEMLDKFPVINYTFSSNTSADTDLDLIVSSSMKLQEDLNKTMDTSAEHTWRSKREGIPPTRVPSWPKTAGVKGSGFQSLENWDVWKARGTVGAVKDATATTPAAEMSATWTQPVLPQETSKLMQADPDVSSSALSTPPYRPGVVVMLHSATRCPQAVLKESLGTSPPVTVIAQKINPCVMELCRFFQLCLCVSRRRYSRKEAMRYCVEYYSWFLKNASYVCEKVKRKVYSQTLKQKCLANICKSI
ncbi:HERV-H LTR-associating protein 1 [Eudromia elegans]